LALPRIKAAARSRQWHRTATPLAGLATAIGHSFADCADPATSSVFQISRLTGLTEKRPSARGWTTRISYLP